ncbi:MAG: hypothetical protein OEY41_15825 [Acidimicrobiia bacterium]|nr:hypothetical protein [Acidimicrobiia bacterium]MDH4365340.1 hypothetical protein [Acidimicrobiia bacterium]MDH5291463.1 hypothetical protein [Acidimicrobiia bacterium]
MEWFSENWPVLLVLLGLLLVFIGLIRKLIKLAFVGVAVGVVALVLWPMVSS